MDKNNSMKNNVINSDQIDKAMLSLRDILDSPCSVLTAHDNVFAPLPLVISTIIMLEATSEQTSNADELNDKIKIYCTLLKPDFAKRFRRVERYLGDKAYALFHSAENDPCLHFLTNCKRLFNVMPFPELVKQSFEANDPKQLQLCSMSANEKSYFVAYLKYHNKAHAVYVLKAIIADIESEIDYLQKHPESDNA